MHRLLVCLGAVAAWMPAAAFAQAPAGPLSGPRPDIRNSDLGAHDSFSTPDMHDMLLRQRARELSDRLSAQPHALGASRPAKASELSAGASVNDNRGVAIAKIEEVDADGVIVSNGNLKVKVPVDAFGHNRAGLLLDMTKADFEKIVAKANGAS
jgi:hypothetical protein